MSTAQAPMGQPPTPAPVPEPPMLDKGGSRAQAAWLAYRGMGPGRSIRKLATVWEADTGKSWAARRMALERWCNKYEWVRDAMAWDAERSAEEQREKDAARKLMDEQQAALAKLATTRIQARMNALMALDERDQADYEAQYEAYTVAMATWSALVTSGEATTEQLLNPPKAPKQPRVRFTAHALVQFWERSTALERMAREAATAVVAVQQEAQLPPVVEVRLATSPPPEPIDPLEAAGVLPPMVAAAARAAIPPAMVGLATQPPSDPDEWGDDDEG